MNLPNKITIARIVMVPLFIAALFSGLFGPAVSRYVAAGIFMLASLSDLADGYLARKLNLITTFGKFMDPVADKLLVSSALVSLAALGDIAAWMVAIFIGRDILIAGVKQVAAERGIVIAASLWGKIKTAMQMMLVILLLLRTGETDSRVYSAVCELTKWLSVAFTAISAYDYIYKNRDIFKDDTHKVVSK